VAGLSYKSNVASTSASSGDHVNSVVFSTTVFGQKFGTGTLAVTYYRSMNRSIVEADILFNKNQQFDSYRGPLRYNTSGWAIGDIRRVFIHELGHALGLDHPDQHGQHVDAIMNSVTGNREALSSDDIAGAQALYGASTPLVVPEATPTPLNDFNGDGKPDYLLYNVSTRQTAVWYLNNNAFVAGAYAPTLPAGWRVVGVADFNGDSQPDYLLFNASTRQTAIWYLSGATLIGGAYGPSLPSGWELVTVSDFNADNKPDYLLYNAGTRQTAIWYLNNNMLTSGAFAPTLPANWRVVGVADFNRDGEADYLLCNASTRQTAIWYLSGPTLIGSAYGPMIASGYTLIGAADFNADGKPDYLLYRPSVQGTTLWYLDNNVFTGSVNGPTLPAGWSLTQP
jgi:FG-GAP-like repeat/Matrixin